MLEKDCQRKLTFEKVFFKDFDFIIVQSFSSSSPLGMNESQKLPLKREKPKSKKVRQSFWAKIVELKLLRQLRLWLSSIGIDVASEIRGPQFESSHRKIYS